MKTREQAVAYALSWRGTRFVQGARVRGAGCDCETLIEAYLIEIGVTDSITTAVYSCDWFRHCTQ